MEERPAALEDLGRLRILILSTAYPLRGGIAHFNALLARALASRHDVQTITFKRQYPAFLFPGRSQQEQDDQPPAPPAPQLMDSINPINWFAVGAAVRRLQPDLIIFKYWLPFFAPCFGTIARVAKHGTRTKSLVVCDNVVPHEHRPFDSMFTRYLFSATDFFIVQSRAVERDLIAFNPGAVYRYTPHPVYEIFGEAIPCDEARRLLGITASRVLLFFGYVRRYKGLHVLLDALARVLPGLEVLLLVVGEFYEDERPYRSQITALGLDSHVSLHARYVSNTEVSRYFSAADAVVLPYLSATQSGIAQIAYNFDVPAIASDVGGLAEVVQDGVTGFVVPPDDPEALAGAILRLYDPGMRELLIRNVAVEKHRYSWGSMVRAVEEMAGI